MGDYYGAIVLLKQTVNYDPSHAEAWLILGNCQEKTPKWRREAANSYHKALAANPNSVEALLSLGDLYRSEGLGARAETFYQDILKIDPEHEIAKKRLKALK
jgi:tetratricopeptide (TPR) repeat protein